MKAEPREIGPITNGNRGSTEPGIVRVRTPAGFDGWNKTHEQVGSRMDATLQAIVLVREEERKRRIRIGILAFAIGLMIGLTTGACLIWLV